MSLLALDLGSSNLKGAIFSPGLVLLAQASLPVTYSTWQDPLVEIDPETFWLLFLDLCRQLFEASNFTPFDIDHVAISSQAQTFLLLDRDLQPLTPLISWIDRRGSEYASHLAQSMDADFHQTCSFPSTIPELQLSKLYSLHQARSELLQETALVASLPSWLSLRLGGPPILDRNLAAMSGLYSLKTGDWNPTALDLCGLKPGQLPRLVDCGEACAVNSESGFISIQERSPALVRSKAVTIHSCGNDQTCGALAAGLQPGEVLLTLGTALVVYRLAGATPGPYSPSGCWGPYPGEGYYELLVSSQGTSALDWARKEFFPGSNLDDLEQLATSLPAALAQTPPFFFPQAMGTSAAFSRLADPPALAWSVYEGLSFSLRRLLDAHAGSRPGLCLVSGGGSRSRTWLQMISDATGVPVRRCAGLAGSPLLGAALQVYPDFAAQSTRTGVDGYQPNPTEVLYLSKRYQQWLQVHPCEGGRAPKTGA